MNELRVRLRWSVGMLGAVCVAPSVAWALSCLPVAGDVNGSGAASVSDVQCAAITALWELGGYASGPPGCASPLGAADLNCSGGFDVSDVQLGITLALGISLDPVLDANADLCVDACELEPNAPPIVWHGAWERHWRDAVSAKLALAQLGVDPEGEMVALADAGPAEQGNVAPIGNGVHAVYSAPPGYVGKDSFPFVLSDGQASAGGSASLLITNQAPVATADAWYPPAGVTARLDVLANDIDADPQDAAFLHVESVSVLPGFGDLSAQVTADGRAVWVDLSQVEASYFELEYLLSDGIATVPGLIQLSVAYPITVPLDDHAVFFGEASDEIDVLGNDHTPPGFDGTLVVYNVPADLDVDVLPEPSDPSQPQRPHLVAHSVSGVAAEHDLDYAWQWESEPGLLVEAAAVVHVRVLQHAPQSAPDRVAAPKGGSAIVYPLANDMDLDRDALTLVEVGTPTCGTLQWLPEADANGNGGDLQQVPKGGGVSGAGGDNKGPALLWTVPSVVSDGSVVEGLSAVECLSWYVVTDGHVSVTETLRLSVKPATLAVVRDAHTVLAGAKQTLDALLNDWTVVGDEVLATQVAPGEGQLGVGAGGASLVYADGGAASSPWKLVVADAERVVKTRTASYLATDGLTQAWADVVLRHENWAPVLAPDEDYVFGPGPHPIYPLRNDRSRDHQTLALIDVQVEGGAPVSAWIGADGRTVEVYIDGFPYLDTFVISYTASDGVFDVTSWIGITPEPK